MTKALSHALRRLRRPIDGHLDRPLAPDQWTVPAVVALTHAPIGRGAGRDDACLAWRWMVVRQRPFRVHDQRIVRAPARLLEQFLRLEHASDQAIHRFAKRWGVLGLCEDHRLPVGHRPAVAGYVWDPRAPGCEPWRCRPWDGVEATAEWRRYARRARGLLHVAAAVHGGQCGQRADWIAAFDGWRDPSGAQDVPWWTRRVAADRRVVVDLLRLWVQICAVRPELRWDESGAVVEFGGESLAGTLAVQLLLAISRTDGLAVCSGCAAPFAPTKQPARQRRRYCRACQRAGVPLRDAKRASRARAVEP